MKPSRIDDKQTNITPETSGKSGIFEKIRRFFQGDDVFISYSRRDGSLYAAGLMQKLTADGLSCFSDRLGTEPNHDIPDSLKRKIRNCTVFVLVGTQGAAESSFVEKEILEFKNTGRVILPIDFHGAFMRSTLYTQIPGIASAAETKTLLKKGKPSSTVLSFILDSFKYMRRNQRMNRMLWGALSVFLILVAAGGAAGYFANVQMQKAIEAASVAAEKTKEAEEKTKIVERKTKEAEDATKTAEQKAREARDAIKLAEDKAQEAKTAGDLAKEKTEEANAATKLAKDKTDEANKATETARKAEGRAKDALLLQERAEEQFNSQQMAVEALREFPDHPQNALNLAVRAIEMNSKSGETVPEAETALRWLLGQIGGEPLVKYKSKIDALDISRDGRWIVTVGADGNVRLWDTSPRKIVNGDVIMKDLVSLSNMQGMGQLANFIKSFAGFSPDNKWLAVLKNSSSDEQPVIRDVHLFNLEAETITTERIIKSSTGDDFLTSIAWSGNGKWLITGNSDGAVKFWNPAKPDSPEVSVKGEHKEMINPITASDDGRFAVTVSLGEIPKLWNLEDKPGLSEVQYELNLVPQQGLDNVITVASLSTDGQLSITAFNRTEEGASTRNYVVLQRTDKKETVGNLEIPFTVTTVLLSPDQKWLIVQGIEYDKDYESATTPMRLYSVKKPSRETPSDTSSSQSNDKYEFQLIDGNPLINNSEVIPFFIESENTQISRDGKWLVLVGTDNFTRLWDLEHSKPWEHEVKLSGHDSMVEVVSTNNNRLVSGSSDGEVRLWNLQIMKPRKDPVNTEDSFDTNLIVEEETDTTDTVVTEDGKWVGVLAKTALNSKEVYVWDLSQLKTRPPVHIEIPENSGVNDIKFSKDGKWFVISNRFSKTSWLYAQPFNMQPIKIKGEFAEMSESSRWLFTVDSEGSYLWDLSKPNWSDRPSFTSKTAHGGKIFEQSNRLVTLSYDSLGVDVRVFDSIDSVPRQVNQFFANGYGKTVAGNWFIGSKSDEKNAEIWDLRGDDKKPRFILNDTAEKANDNYKIDEINGLLIGYDWASDGSEDEDEDGETDDPEGSRELRIYNLKSPGTLSPIVVEGSANILNIAAAPNLLFASVSDGSINVWDLRQIGKTKEPTYKLSGHGLPVTALRVTADNNYLISGGSDGTVRSWNIKLLAQQKSALRSVIIGKNRNPIRDVKLIPFDNRIIVQPKNDSLRIYTFDLKMLVERAKDITGRRLSNTGKE